MLSNVAKKFIYCIVGLWCSQNSEWEGTGKRSTREKNCYNLSHMLKKLKGWPHTFIEQFINIFYEEVPESFD